MYLCVIFWNIYSSDPWENLLARRTTEEKSTIVSKKKVRGFITKLRKEVTIKPCNNSQVVRKSLREQKKNKGI